VNTANNGSLWKWPLGERDLPLRVEAKQAIDLRIHEARYHFGGQLQSCAHSVGYHNPFDYPRREVLARLECPGAATFRTDAHGTVSFYPDGRRVEPRLPGR